jgi:hypothetical protein
MTSPEAVAVAPVVPTPQRNRLGIAALVIVLVVIALPVLIFIAATIAAAAEGAHGDDFGWAVLGGFIIAGASIAFISPLAIVGVVLGIIALTRHGLRKVQAIIAIVLGVAPALAIFGLPTAIDGFF